MDFKYLVRPVLQAVLDSQLNSTQLNKETQTGVMDFEYMDLEYFVRHPVLESLEDDHKRNIRFALLDKENPRGQLKAILSLAEWSQTHSTFLGREFDTKMKTEFDTKMRKQLARFLSESQNPDLNVRAAKVLPIISGSLADHDVLLALFKSLPYMRDTLLNSLSDKQNPCLQVETARLLADAISWGGHDLHKSFLFDRLGGISKTFGWAHGMMERLASSLSKVQNPDLTDLQVEAARVYSNISALLNKKIHRELFDLPGMLKMLLNSFSNEQHPRLQVQAARLLATGIRLGRHAAYSEIFRSKMMKELVSSFSKAQEATMSGTPDDNLQKALAQLVIKNHSDLLDTLMASLSDQRKPLVQAEAAGLLADVAHSKNNKLCRKILRHPGMMKTLASLLSMDGNSHLQVEAGRVLSHILGSPDDEKRRVLLELSDILDILVNILISNDRRLQCIAANLLGDVKQLRKYEFRSNSDMIKLAVLMSDRKAPVRKAAMRVLSSILRSADDESLRKFLDLPGIPSELVKSLAKDQNPLFQELTASLLALAATRSKHHELCNELLRSRNCLVELLKLLAKREDPDLQVEAARGLCDITEVAAEENSRNKLLDFLLTDHNGMQKLVASLSDDQDLRVRVEAARLLASITRWKDYNLCSKFLWDPG